jgi:prepilin-type N-terminal cleavage/methylation domain-containing protein
MPVSLNIAHQKSGFTLAELIVGMTVFAIGLTSIYALLSSIMGSANFSRQEIVVANLLREQIELVRHIRDTNVQNFVPWDKVLLEWTTPATFASGVFLIENNFQTPEFRLGNDGSLQSSPVLLRDVTSMALSLPDEKARFEKFALYRDDQWRFTHTQTQSGTAFATYLIISPIQYTLAWSQKIIKDPLSNAPQGYIIDVRVILNTRGVFREYDAKTILTDWVR